MKFEHFLITKINLGYIERAKSKGIDPEMWLDKRMIIFYKYCIPSIRAQSNNNFTWLLYLDESTPQEFIDSLKIHLVGFNNVKLFFKYGNFNALSLYVIDDIRSYITSQTTHLITSRVDTDDMLHRDYILKIQKLFTGQDYQPINFDLGYLYHEGKGVVGIARHKCNPFITLIEKINQENSFKTVRHKMHIEYCTDNKKISIKEKPIMWCMSIHDLNVSSDFFARPYLLRKIDLSKDFNFQFQKKAIIHDRILFLFNYYNRVCNNFLSLLLRKLNFI